MHAFFKPVLLIFFLLALFAWIFVQSNTLETTRENYTTSSGMPKQRTNYNFHWDRFSDYIQKTPERLKKIWQGS